MDNKQLNRFDILLLCVALVFQFIFACIHISRTMSNGFVYRTLTEIIMISAIPISIIKTERKKSKKEKIIITTITVFLLVITVLTDIFILFIF